MRIVIGTKNPAKIGAVQAVFGDAEQEYIPLNVTSGVSPQPFSDEETMKGAMNRAQTALEQGKGEIGIGLEGGVQQHGEQLFLCNWGALAVKGGPTFLASGAKIPLPEEVAERLLAGEELGPVMDDFAHKENVRKHEGAVGIFTNGEVDRKEMFIHVMKLLKGQYEYKR